MTDTNLLKSKIALNGHDDFVNYLAKILSLSRKTASEKLNGISKFNQLEIKKITTELNLSSDEISEIFIGGD